MHEEELQKLLERFMEGATTLDEERRLAEHFRRSAPGGPHEAYRRMFALWDEGRTWVDSVATPAETRRLRWRAAVAVGSVAATVALALLFGPSLRTKSAQADGASGRMVVVAQPEVRKTGPTPPCADFAPTLRPDIRPKGRKTRPSSAESALPLTVFGIEPGVYVEPQAASLPAVGGNMGQFCDYLAQAYDEVCRLSPSRQKALRDIAYIYAENTFINTTIAGCTVSLSLASLTQ